MHTFDRYIATYLARINRFKREHMHCTVLNQIIIGTIWRIYTGLFM